MSARVYEHAWIVCGSLKEHSVQRGGRAVLVALFMLDVKVIGVHFLKGVTYLSVKRVCVCVALIHKELKARLYRQT